MKQIIIIGSILIALSAIGVAHADPAPDTCTVTDIDGVSVTVSGQAKNGLVEIAAYGADGSVHAETQAVDKAYAAEIALLDAGHYTIYVSQPRGLHRVTVETCEFVR